MADRMLLDEMKSIPRLRSILIPEWMGAVLIWVAGSATATIVMKPTILPVADAADFLLLPLIQIIFVTLVQRFTHVPCGKGFRTSVYTSASILPILVRYGASSIYPEALSFLPVAVAIGVWHGWGGSYQLTRLMEEHKRIASLFTVPVICLTFLEIMLQILSVSAQYKLQNTQTSLQDNSTTILCLGDSYTFGVGASDRSGSWPAALERRLNADTSFRNIRVINAGNPGKNSSYLLKQLPLLLEHDTPGFLIVCCGENNRWNLRDVDTRHVKTMGLMAQWKIRFYQSCLQIRVVKLMRLSRFRLWNDAPPSPADPGDCGRDFRYCAFLSKADDWLGAPLYKELWDHLINHAPDMDLIYWTLGSRLLDRSIPCEVPASVQSRVEKYLEWIKSGKIKSVYNAIHGSTLTSSHEEVLLFSDCIQSVLNKTLDPDGALFQHHMYSPQDTTAALLVYQWSSPQQALIVRHRSFFQTNSAQSAFLRVIIRRMPDLNRSYLQWNPENPTIMYDVYKRLLRLCNTDKPGSVQALKEATVRFPDWQWAHQMLGIQYARLDNVISALFHLNFALMMCPTDPESWHWKGMCLDYCGFDFKAVTDCYDRAILCGWDPYEYRPHVIQMLDQDNTQYLQHLENLKMTKPSVFRRLPSTPDDYFTDKLYLRILQDDLNTMRNLCYDSNCRFFVHTYPQHTEINDFLRRYGDRYRCLLVSHDQIFDELLKQIPREELFVSDGHCNDKGYSIMADNIFKNLQHHLVQTSHP